MSPSYLSGGVEPTCLLHPTPFTWTDKFAAQWAKQAYCQLMAGDHGVSNKNKKMLQEGFPRPAEELLRS